jgi:hypothetical protein
VLEGDPTKSMDMYFRSADEKVRDDKTADKFKAARQFCQRLGKYRTPFAWAAVVLTVRTRSVFFVLFI